MRNTVWYDQGVIWRPTEKTEEGFRRVVKVYERKRLDVYVLSGADGDHMMSSLHYVGRAFDIRKNGVRVAEIRRALGKDWDVVVYSWGFHCEYDPK